MDKIPVIDTIAFAYRFLFGRIGTVIGIAWLPLLIVSVAGFFYQREMTVVEMSMVSGDIRASGTFFPLLTSFVVFSLFFSAMVAAALSRVGLGQELPPRPVYFAFGKTEWRLFLAYLRIMLAALAFGIIIGVPGVIALMVTGYPMNPATAAATPPPLSLVVLLIVMILALAAFVALLRMMLFLPALAATGAPCRLRRSYDLTKDNVWRIIGISVAVAGPIVLLTYAAQRAVYGADPAAPAIPLPGDDVMLALSVFNYILALLQAGLVYPAFAYAYRALAPTGSGQFS